MSIFDSIARLFKGGDPADASPYYRSISEHFGMDHEPTWPHQGARKVATNELPPERQPITGRNAPLPHGIREVKHGEAHQRPSTSSLPRSTCSALRIGKG
jgi:hypothetical protein